MKRKMRVTVECMPLYESLEKVIVFFEAENATDITNALRRHFKGSEGRFAHMLPTVLDRAELHGTQLAVSEPSYWTSVPIDAVTIPIRRWIRQCKGWHLVNQHGHGHLMYRGRADNQKVLPSMVTSNTFHPYNATRVWWIPAAAGATP